MTWLSRLHKSLKTRLTLVAWSTTASIWNEMVVELVDELVEAGVSCCNFLSATWCCLSWTWPKYRNQLAIGALKMSFKSVENTRARRTYSFTRLLSNSIRRHDHDAVFTAVLYWEVFGCTLWILLRWGPSLFRAAQHSQHLIIPIRTFVFDISIAIQMKGRIRNNTKLQVRISCNRINKSTLCYTDEQ